LFRDWQRTQTQSSEKAAAQPLLKTANGWMVLRIAGILPRGTKRIEKLPWFSFFALLRARRESFFLLTKLIMDGRMTRYRSTSATPTVRQGTVGVAFEESHQVSIARYYRSSWQLAAKF
jgi:hypothetical protein